MGVVSAIRVTLVVDNHASEGLRSEHGLSFLVETDVGSVMFDTGQSDAWFHNLIALGREPRSIKAIAISHGHYDHTGGLVKAVREAPGAQCFTHPACFEPKYARSTGETRYIGMPLEVVSGKTAFKPNTSVTEILRGVVLSGEIPLRTSISFDSRFVTEGSKSQQDTFEDEQCMIIRHGDSTAVLVGCAHRGLENNLLAAMDVAGVDRIDLLAGGFHLGNASEDKLDSLADFLKNADIGQIACCHCTGFGAYEYLRLKLGHRVTLARAGV
ncbi:MBL fold metallo-hydrolase, partial [bacterium]|nr:MBL fold metallo-hydrolase [bacterium]